MSEFEEKLFSVSATLRTRQVHKRFSLTNGRLDWTHQQCLGMKYTTTTTALQNTIYIYCLRNLYLHLTFFPQVTHSRHYPQQFKNSINPLFVSHSFIKEHHTWIISRKTRRVAAGTFPFHIHKKCDLPFIQLCRTFSDIFIHNELWSTNTSWLLH